MNKLIPIFLTLLLIPLVFAATPDGSVAAGDNMNIFITLLFIVMTLGLFYSFFIMLTKAALIEVSIYDVLFSWSSYILLIFVNHLTAHYVEDVFMYTLTNQFLTYTAWTNIILPLIAFIISFIIRSFEKKKPLTPQEVGGFRYG